MRFGVPNYFHNGILGNGFGDLDLGFKQQLGPMRGFDVSLIPSLSLPTGADLISSHGYDAALQLPWSRSLSKNWTTAGQFATMWPTESGRHNLNGQASVYFDRQLTAPWDAYAEYSGAFLYRYHGILMTMMRWLPRTSSSSLSSCARWLCNGVCHQCLTTSSGTRTAIWRSGQLRSTSAT